MARVFPFRGLRPKPELVGEVASPLFDVVSTEEARKLAEGNPNSFLRVDKPAIEFPPGHPQSDPALYEKASENLRALVSSGVLAQDAAPCFYIYRLATEEKTQTGLAACLHVGDYEKNIIKKHELTRPDKEADRAAHIRACSAHASPVLCAYRSDKTVNMLMHNYASVHEPVFNTTTDGEVTHTIWVVSETYEISSFTRAFESVPSIYIADGHHRSAAAARAADIDNEESQKFLSVLFPHDEMSIMDYNRAVKDLNGLFEEEFIEKLSVSFETSPSDIRFKPEAPHEYGMYAFGKWKRLKYKSDAPDKILDRLPVSVLQNEIMKKILNIGDPRTDKRIDFVGGSRGIEYLEAIVDSGEMAAAFTVCPTSMEDLLSVADSNLIMPPKSTWFEPKLLSGLLVHMF